MIKAIASYITFIVAFTLLVSTSSAQESEQKTFSKQFSFISDNDFYLFGKKDGYYTNGFILKYDVASKLQKTGIVKRINNFEAGHLMFNQGVRKIQDISLIDRPITGFLYGKFTQSNFISDKQFYQLGVSAGTIGKAAFGEGMQDFYHKLISVNSNYWGWIWDYQLRSEPGINVHGSYATSLIKKDKTAFQVTPQVNATLGTTFTNITPGVLIQAGKFNSSSESSYWGSTIQKSNSSSPPAEYFLFYHPRLTYQAYNATIQGGMFRDDKGPITSSVEPFVFLQEAGIMISKSRYLFSYTMTHQTREAKSQKSNHAFGRIQVAYRFN